MTKHCSRCTQWEYCKIGDKAKTCDDYKKRLWDLRQLVNRLEAAEAVIEVYRNPEEFTVGSLEEAIKDWIKIKKATE